MQIWLLLHTGTMNYRLQLPNSGKMVLPIKTIIRLFEKRLYIIQIPNS